MFLFCHNISITAAQWRTVILSRVMKTSMLWVINECDMQYFTGRKNFWCEVVTFSCNVLVIKTNFCPRFLLISLKKKVII